MTKTWGTFVMEDTWADLFVRKGPGDSRMPDMEAAKYPSKTVLLKEQETLPLRICIWDNLHAGEGLYLTLLPWRCCDR